MTLESLVDPQVRAQAPAHADAFAHAQPFRHVVIENFLSRPLAERLLEQFPAFERGNHIGDDGRPGQKSTLERMAALGDAYRELDETIKSRAFLDYLGQVTGIPDLIYDPFYLGGGTHENRQGQPLSAHVDFNYHPSERWHRRLNLIVYLNHHWDDTWGGSLDLYRDPYEDPVPAVRVAPLFNRCVIFETTENSWHGFEKIQLPDEHSHLTRKSIALYFYTKERPAEETAGRHTTHYVNAQLPERVVPGYTLTGEDVDLLKALVTQRDVQMKMLYEENARLLQAQDSGFGGHLLYLLKRLYVRYRR